MAVSALVARCPPLDLNASYCYLLQCEQFTDTCAVVERDGKIVGFVSGHLMPRAPQTLFIWQVAVDAGMRGHSLGRLMMAHILDRPQSADFKRLCATITKSNRASAAMFASLAKSRGATIAYSPYFDREQHFNGEHDSELLLTIDFLKKEIN